MINSKIILKVLSRNLFILTIALAFCIEVAIHYQETTLPFTVSAFVSFAFGIALFFISRNQNEHITIQKREAYLIVTLSWLLIGLFGCLPYLFSKSTPSFVDAFFESISGFTTTGSSILTDIESLPKSILFWRSLTHWIGGIGIIVLVIIVMPTLQIGGYQLFSLESSLQEKIKPKINSVGKRLLIIYITLTLILIVLLSLFGMNLFESTCHAFGTIATGGFSPKNDSLASYSPAIQYIIMIFMVLSGTNFVIHYSLLKRNFSKIKEDEEFKFYLGFTFALGALITAAIFLNMNKSFEESFRDAFFQIISIITTTGFATSDYLLWPSFAWLILFFAMFLGGSTGSTAGGIKITRHVVLFKTLRRMIKMSVSPNAVIPVKLNKQAINNKTNNSILTFISSYFIIFLIGSLIIVFMGVNKSTAFSAVATCMAGIGPGINSVGPTGNFANLPHFAKYLLIFLMLVGRLEIYTIVTLFTRSFWTK